MAATNPPLSTLVRAGDAQAEAIDLGQGIFMARDISNAYLVTTNDGDVLVNTGFMDHATRNVALFAPRRSGRVTHIVLTQSHADHFGGVPEFRDAETVVIGGKGFAQAWGDMKRLQPFFARARANCGAARCAVATPLSRHPKSLPISSSTARIASNRAGAGSS